MGVVVGAEEVEEAAVAANGNSCMKGRFAVEEVEEGEYAGWETPRGGGTWSGRFLLELR